MKEKKRYSIFIKPLLYLIDLLIIGLISYRYLTNNITDICFFLCFWIALSIYFSFYKVYRFTKIIKILTLLTQQTLAFILIIISYLYFKNSDISPNNILIYFVILYITFNIWRNLVHIVFKKYRIITGLNYKKVVIIGLNESTKRLENFFKTEPSFGYKYMGFFTNENNSSSYGNISESFQYIITNNIDEVYSSVKELTNKEIKEFIDFCDINLITLKFIPDTKEIFSKNLYLHYYDITPVLSLREIPLVDSFNSILKRSFDIIFALFVIIFLLSWLIPILGLIIVLESKGPVFFKQNRPGIKEEGFGCYKFRSMAINSKTEVSATRNDARITKIGKFIRRTSIDELPQFYNVLFGSMSVVGPRPHLWRQNEIYGPKIPKYMVRHYVKPGITGLAQVRGYRGEIETKEDIINRTKYDIFYIENWSFLLDLNIIIQTVINIFKGEDKAY